MSTVERNPLLADERSPLLHVLLGGLLVFQGVAVSAGGQRLPLSELAAVAILGVALFHRPQRQLSKFGVLGILAFALLAFLVGSTVVNDGEWVRRAFRIAALMSLVGVFASGRMNFRAALQGATAAMALNIPLFYLGLLPDTYGGVLTGLFGDKNVAGLYYAVVPLLLAATYENPKVKWALIAFGGIGTVLTDSRTSMAAFVCAVVWLLVSRRLNVVFRLGLLAALFSLVNFLSENFARALFFSDRVGSDRLRESIDAASWIKVTESPWYGNGLNSAIVTVEGNQWFFHNSYWALWAEGGWIFTIVVVAAYVLLGLRPFSTLERTPSRITVEAASIVFLICASRLGEVFITIPGMLVLAAGLMLTAEEMKEREEARYRATIERVNRLRAGSHT